MATKPHTTHGPTHAPGHTTHAPYTPKAHPAPSPPQVEAMAAGTVKVDNHTMKSPSHMAQAVNDYYGSTVITKFGVLDPTLAEKQINAAAGATNFRKTGPLDRGLTDPKWSPDGLSHAMGLS